MPLPEPLLHKESHTRKHNQQKIQNHNHSYNYGM